MRPCPQCRPFPRPRRRCPCPARCASCPRGSAWHSARPRPDHRRLPSPGIVPHKPSFCPLGRRAGSRRTCWCGRSRCGSDVGRMAAAMATGGNGFEGCEVVRRARGYRRWPDKAKARIVTESFQPGVRMVDVARRHGLAAHQLSEWRRQARQGNSVFPADVMAQVASDALPRDRKQKKHQYRLFGEGSGSP